MPLDVQTRLLRVLSDGEFYRVGGYQSIKVDVRIIAATHQNLEELVKQGLFRDDLFHRLNVVRLRLPALRERTEDIERLAQYFLNKSAKELKVECKVLSSQASEKLQEFNWLGNVRQLENSCRWLTVMAPGQLISIDDLPDEITEKPSHSANSNWLDEFQIWLENELKQGKENIWPQVQHQLENRLIKSALANCNGHKQDAAVKIGWGRNTLTRKLKEQDLG
jgi:two-component system nitrogen regulation response regulator GlnG